MANSDGVVLELERLVGAGIVSRSELRGCSDEEIRSIEEGRGVRLPPAYKTFLRGIGKASGAFLRGTDFLYPRLLQLNEVAAYLLEESGSSFRLATSDFAFISHQGYAVMFFSCERDDPPIFRYIEGDEQPEKVFSSFVEWLKATIDDEIMAHHEGAQGSGH